jgi:hypothetical protein
MHTNLSSTIQQYSSGSNYGYVCGGYSSGYLSTIDRFQFPFDSGTANQVGNLSGSRYASSANNSSTHGYVCGGLSNSNHIWLSTIDRFQFPFDSGTSSYIGNLSGNKGCSSANNCSTYGYVYGGYSFDNGSWQFSTIDRFQFPFDNGTASQAGNLNRDKYASSANNSSTHGYVCGGSSFDSDTMFSTIDRFQFPFDSGTANQVGNLSESRGHLSANNSSTHGYVCGGESDSGDSFLSTIDCFQFPFDSGIASHVDDLSESRERLSANNSSIYGYVCGGTRGISVFSTIDRFQFPFNSGTTSQVGNLSESRDWPSAADGVDFVTMFM